MRRPWMMPTATFVLVAAALLLPSRSARADDIFAAISFTNNTADPITITSGKAEGTGWHDPGPQGNGATNVADPVNMVVMPGKTLAFGTWEHNGFLGTNGTGGDITFNKPDGTVVTLDWSVPWGSFHGLNTGCGDDIGLSGPPAGIFIPASSPVDVKGGALGSSQDTCLYEFHADQPKGTLPAGTSLCSGHSALSSDGRFALAMQTDGNLVLYYGPLAIWSTQTWGSGATVATMQTDGNFVVYDNAQNVIWAANWSPGFVFTPGASLTIQNDANLVIYSGDPAARGATNWIARTGYNFFGQNVNYNTQPTGGQDWSVGNYKGQCIGGQAVVGLSETTSETHAQSILCGVGTGSNDYPMTSCHGLSFDPTNNQVDTNDGDWDFGYAKAECGASEFVGGVSQSTSGAVNGLLCCSGNVNHTNCSTELLFGTNSADYTGPDWSFGDYKGQCPAGQYVAGVSASPDFNHGLPGSAHRILCCSP